MMERRTYLTGLGTLGAAGVAGCVGDEEPTDGEVVADVDPEDVSDHELFEQYHDPRATHVRNDEYAVAVETLEYTYIPGGNNPIEVPGNSEVTFYLASLDITHAFTVEDKNLNVEVPPGVIVEATVEFDEHDELVEYEITCGEEFCVDHDPEAREVMVGRIQVLPSWED